MSADSPRSDSPPPLNYATPSVDLTGKLVTVATFGNVLEANLAMAKLQEHGIRCFTTGEALFAGVGTYVGAVGRVELTVADTDKERAEKLIRAVERARAARLVSPVAPPCPACGASGAHKRLGRGWMAVISIVVGFVLVALTDSMTWMAPTILVAIYLILTWDRQRWTCAACGKRFTGKAVEIDRDEDED